MQAVHRAQLARVQDACAELTITLMGSGAQWGTRELTSNAPASELKPAR
jgi:hypothetical protein